MCRAMAKGLARPTESGRQPRVHIPRCGAGERVSECQGLLHCGTLSLHQNRAVQPFLMAAPIKVPALDWSDTATFLLEAEVDRIDGQ